jgi:hypothetical protein
MSPGREEPSFHFIATTGAVPAPAVAAVARDIENGGARAAFKVDREWFTRHSGRRYRMRPLLMVEMPIDDATHMLVVRVSSRMHYRIAWRLGDGEPVSNTDREIAALLGIETVI